MSRSLIWSLYALLVVIWSSTWVAIKLGLKDAPPFLAAGIRFAAAGALLLLIAAAKRDSVKTDFRLAGFLAALPFFAAYGLIYWGEQHVPSGLAAVLFAGLPLYVALMAVPMLPEEPLRGRLLVGLLVCIGGLVLAFGESIELGDDELAVAGALACMAAPLASAAGNVALKLRSVKLDAVVLNGWAMLAAGLAFLFVSAPTEDWGATQWTPTAVGSIAYLTVVGSAVPFVVLTILFRELPAVTMSFISLLIPFGALALGALLADEALTAVAVGGAVLVAAGLLVAQWPARGGGVERVAVEQPG